MNQSGENGLARNNENLLLLLFMLGMIAACAAPAPAPVEDREVKKPVATPAQPPPSGGVQVYPLQNPAVKSLLEEAREAEASGDYDRAVISLERALRIQPRDPELLQYMAEMQLHKEDYQQAMSFAIRSYDTGSRVGEICTRNWHVISVAREHTGDEKGAVEANQRAGECISAKPQGY
jgi:tetratricopeptide (TPR) repeat protein